MVFYFSYEELSAYIFPADGKKPDGTIIMNAEVLKGTKDKKCAIRYIFSGKAWNKLIDNKTAFTSKKYYEREEREAQWVLAQRTLHGLQELETSNTFNKKRIYTISEMAEQAKRRAEDARLRELHTMSRKLSLVKLMVNLDIDTIQQHYTV